MDRDVAIAGPRSPLTDTPSRRPGSIRRTASIDTVRPAGSDTARTVDARAREVFTNPDGTADTIGTIRLAARVDPRTYELLAISSDPADRRLDELAGIAVSSGFRRRLAEVLDGPGDQLSLALLLLDDLPGAQLVAGYDMVHRRGPGQRRPDGLALIDVTSRADFCAGWATDGALLEGFRRTAEIPVPLGPPAPPLEAADDVDAWHVMTPLPPGGMRRRRRLDLFAADEGLHRFEAYFRDSHRSDSGEETILHEYRVTGAVDASARTLVSVHAEARVLPYGECPNALGSAQQVVGWSLDELRRAVHRQLVGTSSCTHLNDTLRSLADIEVLLDHITDHTTDHTTDQA